MRFRESSQKDIRTDGHGTAVLFPCRPPPNRALFADPHPVATSIVPMAWTLQIFEKISKTSILKWHVFRWTWSWRNRCFPMEVCDNSGIPRVVDDRSGPAIYLASRFPVGGLKLGEAAQLGSLKKLVWDFKKHWLVGGSIYWECHSPNWRTHIFQRGWNIGNVIIPPSFFRGVGWNHQPDHH